MRAAPLLISWHEESQPIYSVHFDPHGKGRLATAGADNNIRLWSLERDGDEAKVSFLATLVRHSQTVNVVRFCPKGELLASAGDDGNVILWTPSDSPTLGYGEDHADDKEFWRIKTTCRTNTGAEIYDLAWSPDGRYFITGAMDNTARIIDSHSGMLETARRRELETNKACRQYDQSYSRTQSLHPRRCMGSSERIHRNTVFRSHGTYLCTEA